MIFLSIKKEKNSVEISGGHGRISYNKHHPRLDGEHSECIFVNEFLLMLFESIHFDGFLENHPSLVIN